MNKTKKRFRRLSREKVNGGLQLSPVPPQIYLSRISATAWCLSASPQGLCLSLAAGNLPRSGASWKRTKTHNSWDNIWGNKPHRSPSNLFLITYEVQKQRWAIQPRLQGPLSLAPGDEYERTLGGRLVATGTFYVVWLWDAELLITRISARSTDHFKGI